MAGAIIIACGIGVLLLVLTGSMIVSGTLASGNSIISAQKDMTALKENQLNTIIEITYTVKSSPTPGVWFITKNTGNTIIDYSKMNFIVATSGSPARMYFTTMGDGNGGTWNSDNIHYAEGHPVDDNCELVNPNQWDPGEYLYVWIGFSQNPTGVWAITPNGATSYRAVA